MYKKMCLFSIIIPTYNRCRELRLALESIEKQTLHCMMYEVIIVDNHSEDGTFDVIRASNVFAKILQVNNHGNIAYSRNLGAKNARGRYLVFLDSDDRFTPTKLDEIRRALLLNTKIQWMYHRIKGKTLKM